MTEIAGHALVIAPHADDESIGCGGTLCRLGAAGWRLSAILITVPSEGAERLREYQYAASGLGIGATEFLDYPEQQVPEDPALVSRLYASLRTLAPDLVLVPHGTEDDPDHRMLNRLIRAALWMAHRCDARPVPTLWEYEVWTPLQRPDLLVDITAFAERKRTAIAGYRSQMAIRDYAGAALGLNAYRACMSARGHGFCEAFATPGLPGQQERKDACIPLA